MNKFFIISGGLALVFSLAGCQDVKAPAVSQQSGFSTAQSPSSTETSSERKQPVQAPVAELKSPQEPLKGITIKADGFAPSNITIAPGTKVIFINMDDSLHWPASGVHPTHEICPGFDALKGLAKNETYTFTFTQAKTCPLHDHLNPALKGKIIVQ